MYAEDEFIIEYYANVKVFCFFIKPSSRQCYMILNFLNHIQI